MKTCAVVLVVVVLLGATGNPVSGWVTWYATTHHRQELKTTPPQDSNDVSSHLATPRNTAELPAELDLLKLLNVSGATPGVSEVLGPTERLPAYKFRPGYSNVLVPAPAAIAAALTAPAGFTVIFVYRQHRKTLGTLVSVHSPGRVTPWFQITSNLRTGQLVLHYRVTSDSKLHQNSWALLPPQQAVMRNNPSSQTDTKRANGWTHLGLVYSASSGLLTLNLDCGPPREQPLAGAGLHVPEEALVYFRQEPGFKKKFLGSMQIAKIIPRPLSRKQLGWTCGPAP